MRVLSGISFILRNFATPIAFYLTFHFYGAKPAIALAIAVTLLQVFGHWIYRIRLSPFFMVASGFTVGFGLIDLFLARPRFFRLEPFAQNFLIGMVFTISLFTRAPIAAWFAAALPERMRPNLDVGEKGVARYLKQVTLAWSVYLIAKAFFFLYLAFAVDLGTLFVLRTLVGGGSLVVMFLGEVAYRKWFRNGAP